MIKKRFCESPIGVQDILGDVLSTLGVSRKIEHHFVFQVWEELLPQKYKKYCDPIFFRYGKLIIKVKSASVFDELNNFYKHKIIEVLNNELKNSTSNQTLIVKKIEFKLN